MMETEEGPQLSFRLKWSLVLLNLISTSLVVAISLLVILPIGLILFWMWQEPKITELAAVLTLIFSPVLLLAICTPPYQIGLFVGRFFLSRIKVSKHGMEYRHWPFYGVQCEWKDIDRVGKYRAWGIIPYEVLYLRTATSIKPNLNEAIRRWLKLKPLLIIPVGSFQGWPEGELINSLRKHAPHAFSESGSTT